MHATGHTTVFPREDNVYTMKQSFPFDEVQTKPWQNRPRNKDWEEFKEWYAYVLMGVLVGCAGMLGYIGVAELIGFVMKWNHHFIHSMESNGNEDYGVFLPWLVFVGCSTVFGFLGCAMTAYYAQGASMSGLPEIIAITNGINYPEYFGLNILLTKMVGNTLAVSAKMCVGKEGPLAHSGANIGIATLYIPGVDLKFLQNDEKRREFMSAGASAGVAIAFGAPLGGALFVYEHNWPNGFWRNKVF